MFLASSSIDTAPAVMNPAYEEIARTLDIPIGTVKTHIHRGRKMLVSMYAEGRPK